MQVHIAFDCESMKPLLTWKYTDKLSKDVKDIGKLVGKYLPEGDYIYNDEEKWMNEIENEKFELDEGKIVERFKDLEDDECRIYKFNLLNDEMGKKLLKRSEILTLFFIEAGSYIEIEDDDRWEIYVVYKKVDGKDELIGYSTVYKYWKYEINGDEDKYRGRISQVLVIPPFQGRGYGKKIYENIVNEWRKDEKCYEITVEDPSEEFDELRDKCDLEKFINDGLDREIVGEVNDKDIDRLRKVTKLTRRQMERVIEMCKLWMIKERETKDVNSDKELRLMIKKRIYLQNREGLEALDAQESKSKIQETYLRVLDGYKTTVSGVKTHKRRANAD